MTSVSSLFWGMSLLSTSVSECHVVKGWYGGSCCKTTIFKLISLQDLSVCLFVFYVPGSVTVTGNENTVMGLELPSEKWFGVISADLKKTATQP